MMNKSETLPEDIMAFINKCCREGDAFVENGDYVKALVCYESGLEKIPEPKELWEATTWLLMAIGESYIDLMQYHDALNVLRRAIYCPGGLGNPLVHLRLGQTYFELGKRDEAKDELARAYMGGGMEIFEHEDKKYWDFVRENLADCGGCSGPAPCE